MTVLVTGVAGFIGFSTAQRLLARGEIVIGIDNLDPYYDVTLKQARLDQLRAHNNAENFTFQPLDISDADAVNTLFKTHVPSHVIHLAAQPGVRYSLENPAAYVKTNVLGFTHILEACRHHGAAHLTYASTSSVYGANTTFPASEHHSVDHPLQFYAATKRANELMAHSYSHLYRLPTTGLRFFTVYGPWGRPDMAPFLFTKNILEGRSIDVFNHGKHSRDFTYIDDIVEGILRVNDQAATPNPDWDAGSTDPQSSNAPYRIYNIGHGQPTALLDFIKAIERATGKTAHLNMLPLQAGDALDTSADVKALKDATGYQPDTSLETGVRAFVNWYKEYYSV